MLPALLLAVSAVASQGTAAPIPDARTLEDRVVAQRAALARGHIELESSIRIGERSIKTRRSIYFDGRKIRGDVTRLDGQKSDERDAPAREINCFNDKSFIYYNDEPIGGGHSMAINLVDLRSFTNDRETHSVSDPRLLGIAPTDVAMLVYFRLNALVVGSGTEPRSVSREAYKGQDCYVVSRGASGGPGKGRLRLWIAPAKGMGVVRSERRSGSDDSAIVDSVESELERIEGPGIWYPRTCHYRRVEGGKVTREQDVLVTSATFNQPIDPAVFTLAGMEVPVGKRVLPTPSENGTFMWDGHRVVASSTPAELAPAERFRKGGTFLGVSSVLLLVVAGGAAWRAFWKGKA